ncbi:MAG: hypothetical protein NTW03_17490, partial [Verrucomicrobia bacterium]|nr:hypothetical protein [Verrucomicrobiota bacterium]
MATILECQTLQMKKACPTVARRLRAALAAIQCALLMGWAAPKAVGVPACPRPVAVQQPDGTSLRVCLQGDEHVHWHEDADGFTVLQEGETGRWVHAKLDAKGGLVRSESVVGRDDPLRLRVPRHLLPTPVSTRRIAARSGNAAPSPRTGRSSPSPPSGERAGERGHVGSW